MMRVCLYIEAKVDDKCQFKISCPCQIAHLNSSNPRPLQHPISFFNWPTVDFLVPTFCCSAFFVDMEPEASQSDEEILEFEPGPGMFSPPEVLLESPCADYEPKSVAPEDMNIPLPSGLDERVDIGFEDEVVLFDDGHMEDAGDSFPFQQIEPPLRQANCVDLFSVIDHDCLSSQPSTGIKWPWETEPMR